MNKTCAKCKTGKPIEAFGKNRRTRDGLQSRCKPCHVRAVVESQHRHPDAARARRKLWAQRHPKENSIARQAYNSRYYREHDERLRLAARKRNHERLAEIAALRQTASGQEAQRRKKANRRRMEANGDLPVGRLPAVLMRDVKAAFDDRCVYCGAAGTLEIDHFEPLSRGGRHVRGNLVAACSKCNDLKAFFDPFEWMERSGIDSDLVIAKITGARV